jgi:hypothetical protein
MTIYLAIITTALVLTQIIRLLQNMQQLKKMGRDYETVKEEHEMQIRVFHKFEEALDWHWQERASGKE